MGGFAFGTHYLLSKAVGNTISTMAAILVGIVVYGVLIVLTKTVTPVELAMVPAGRKINRIISKFVKWE